MPASRGRAASAAAGRRAWGRPPGGAPAGLQIFFFFLFLLCYVIMGHY